MHSEIIVLMDRTGSMHSIKSDMEGGFDTWIAEQRKVEGTASVTLLQFDSEGKDVVYSTLGVGEVPPLNLEPRSMTPLYDAIMWGIPIAEQHAATEQPDHVFFVVITDGHENDSKEATAELVAAKVKELTDKAKWNFVFLGANQDAVLSAKSIGIDAGRSLTFNPNSQSVGAAYDNLSSNMCSTRCMSSGSAFTSFSAEQRDVTIGKVTKVTKVEKVQ